LKNALLLGGPRVAALQHKKGCGEANRE